MLARIRLARLPRLAALILVLVALPVGVHRLALRAGPSGTGSPAYKDSEYEVVKLLTRLFDLIKKNYGQTMDIRDDLIRTTDRSARQKLLARLEERIVYVEEKSEEYVSLMPGLEQSYPRLRTIITSFSKDVDQIGDEMAGLREEHGLSRAEPAPQTAVAAAPAPAPPGDAASRPGGTGRTGGASATLTVPITLEVRRDDDQKVGERKVVFRLEPPPVAVGRVGFMDKDRNLVDTQVRFTGQDGRVTAELHLEKAPAHLRIRRVIIPDQGQTICRLSIVDEAGPQSFSRNIGRP